ncbi:hypothetical protein GCM10027423_59200 [Spirosoma arcticum]
MGVTGTGITAGDYTLSGTTITIPNGATSGSVSFTVTNDTDVEGSETATLTISNPSAGIALGGTTTQNVTIADDDAPPVPTVSIAATDATGAEAGAGSDPITFTVSRTGAATDPLTVTYTVGGTATNGTDYTPALTGTLTLTANQASADITLAPTDDLIFDPGETIILSLTDGPAYDLGTASATVTITDNDVAPATRISAIQGSGTTAALTGTQTIEGIVTRNFSGTAALNGFFVQEEDADSDNNPATSEGISVLDPTGVFTGSIGDKVRVTGAVGEFTSSFGGVNSSLTQLTLTTGANLTNLGASTLPTVTTVTFPVANRSELERYEGMLVTVQAATGNLTVTDNFTLGRFGQVTLAATDPATNQPGTDPRIEQYTQFNLPSVAGNAAYLAAVARRLIILDDAGSVQNPPVIIHARGGSPLSAANTLRAGDDVASISGILDERFEGYRVQTSTPVNFNATNARTASPPAVGGTLKVAGFNVLNYFTDLDNNQQVTIPDGVSFEPRGAETAEEFTRQRDKIIAAIASINADVVGLIEIENNGSVAIGNLVDGLNAVSGAGSYTFVNDAALIDDPNPQANAVGTDAIKVAFIYKPGFVTPVGLPRSSNNTVFSRPPVAQTFQQNSNGAKFTAIVNHFKSKGGSGSGADNDLGDGQGEFNNTRLQQANALISFIPSVTAAAGDPDVLLLGDYNAYALEDPIRTLTDAGFASLRPNSDYSYAFNGQFGFLDYALANASLTAQVSGSADWHINSDEPIILDYNTNFKQNQPANLYAPDPFKASDHDPVVVGLSLTAATTPLALTFTANPTTILTTGTTTLSATVSGGTTAYSYVFSGPGTITQTPTSNTASVSGLTAGVQTFTVLVTDATTPTSQTITGTVSVTVSEANTPPAATANTNQTATVDVPFSYTVNAFNDSETPNSLTYSASIDPANGLVFDPATRIISGVPSMSGVSSVTVVGTDPGSLSASTSFTITVNPAPVVVTPLSLTFTANPTMLLTSGATTLSATVSGGTTAYSYVFSGPGTITPSGNTASVSGLSAGVQTFTVLVTDATTPTSQTISGTVSVTVSAANTPPVATANANQTATVGVPFSYTVAAFTDSETPNGLTYSASIVLANGFGFDPATRIISGVPSMSGVSSVTVTATDPGSLSASTSFTITVSPAPVTPTAPFAITGVTTLDCTPVANRINVNFNPRYAGLNGQPISFSVVNELSPTTAPGPYTLQLYPDNPTIILKAVQSGTAGEASFSYNWLAACNSLSMVTPNNTAPTTTGIANQSGTVNQGFSLNVASSFSDAETPNGLSYSATGLPAGLSLSGSTISGTPSMSGVSTVTVTATDPGSLSVATSFSLTVSPAASMTSTGTFSITGVTTIDCTPVANRIAINFNPRYAGLNGQPISFSVINELSPTTAPGPYSLTLYPDNPVITLKAVQSGTTGEASFSYNWLAACNSLSMVSPNNTAPTTTGIANQSGTVNQGFSLNVASSFSDAETPNGLSFSATGLPAGLSLSGSTISGTPSMSGVSNVTVVATDPGSLSVATSFTFTVSPSSTTVSPPPTSPFSITGVTTVSCTVISPGQREVSFTPQYAGTNGQPISFSVVNELSPTTAPGPYTLRLYTDNPTITLKATQSGTAGEATFSYNWFAACTNGSGARVGVEPVAELSVRVLGNPVQNGQVRVEVRGAAGQSLRLLLTDLRGQAIGTHSVKQAGMLEQHVFEIGRQAGGVLLLRASTPAHSQTVKVLQID